MIDHAVNLPAGAGASTSSSGLALANAPKDKCQILARFLRLLDIRKTPLPSEEHAVEAINCFKLLVGDHVDAFLEGLSPIYRDFALQLLTGNHVDMETLSVSANVIQRVNVLKYWQNKYDKLETKFFKEARQLKAKYLKLYEPLYTKRYEIVNGVIDVEGITNESAVGEEDKAAEENGVPNFWLTVMKTNETLTKEITERDEEALKYLKDIKWCKLHKPYSFKLEFYFDSNPCFQNSVLTKTYRMFKYDDRLFGKSKGTEIEWYPGKYLTHKVLKKMPKKRSKNGKRINTEKCESFFHFFNPPQIPDDDDIDDNAVEELYNMMKHDYEIGLTIKDKIIPHALSYFTEAVQKGSSPNVSQRVEVLKYLQNEYDKLETEALEEKVQLQDKYMNLYEPLYTKMYEIVNGVIDVEGITNEAAEENGVPSFWLTAMKNNKTLAEEITERDKEALKYLKDIKWCRLRNPHIFKLEFYFDPNPYFQNSVLTKTYHILNDIDPIVEKSTGTEIEWHPGKCLTHKLLKKPKKRSRNAKGIINTEKCESFFNFFNPPQIPEDDDDVEELEFLIERDLKIGSKIRDEIIPEAVHWFTGEAGKGKSKSKHADDYRRATRDMVVVGQYDRILSYLKWKPPEENYVKLNTDGACKEGGRRAGCGGVIRGSQGEWLGGFVKGVGYCNAFVTELWGVLEGLRLAQRLGFKRVELSIDSKAVMHVILTEKNQGIAGFAIVKKIRRLLKMDWNVKIFHECWVANKCADALANIGCNLVGHAVIYYETCPSDIRDILLADEMEITTLD